MVLPPWLRLEREYVSPFDASVANHLKGGMNGDEVIVF